MTGHRGKIDNMPAFLLSHLS